jgi:hypothetical protein
MHKRKPKNLRMRSQGQGSIVEKLKGPVLNVEHEREERIQQAIGMNQYKRRWWWWYIYHHPHSYNAKWVKMVI